MSMDFSEFQRRLGADPGNQDPEFLRARHSGPEFEQAVEDALKFEGRLERAMKISAPEALLTDILEVSRNNRTTSWRWKPLAVAAGILIAVGAAGINWRLSHHWNSVDEYLVAHYRHDGAGLVARAGALTEDDVEAIFLRVGAQVAPELAGVTSVIKYCPTPDGKGIHMVLNTDQGPITLIYMPETKAGDLQEVVFDNMHALLVDLPKGSAIIIGTSQQNVSSLFALVQDSIIPVSNEA